MGINSVCKGNLWRGKVGFYAYGSLLSLFNLFCTHDFFVTNLYIDVYVVLSETETHAA